MSSDSTDDFLIIDLSRYQDAYSNLGTADDDDPFVEALMAPDKQPDDELDTDFVPASWRDKTFEAAVEKQIRQMFIQDVAKKRKREIQEGKLEDPPIFLLTDFLAQEDTPARYLIQDLWPVGGNVLFAAPAKFGKSSVTMNLIRSLMDGDAFLGHFDTEKVRDGETILLIDLEMNDDRVRREIREQQIVHTSSLSVAPLRGQAKAFNITNEEVKRFWIKFCKEKNVKTLIIDPLAPLLGLLAIEENDNTAINVFFQQLDAFKAAAGIRNLLVVHHCGHLADWRPRGASRFNDWPDALWLAKVDGDITSTPPPDRLFFARGRNVGDSLNGPGILSRDADKRITFSSAATAAVAAAHHGTVENLVFTKQGQSTRALVSDVATALKMGDKTALKLLHDMEADQRLHSHEVPTDKGKPSYWFTDARSCTYCTGLIAD